MIAGIRFPVDGLGLPDACRMGAVELRHGAPAWCWRGPAPAVAIDTFDADPALVSERAGWAVDHIVVTAEDVEWAVARLVDAGAEMRRWGSTRRGRSAAFLLAGILVEVVSGGTDGTVLWGLALETRTPLHELAARWTSQGLAVRGPHPAVQAGRSILSVGRVAVMTPRTTGRPG